MGTDKTVVNSARVSFGADNQTSVLEDRDVDLIKYLAEHNHWSPFAHTSVQLKVKAPIFVARQLVKHQVGGVWNEISRRYVSFEPEFHTVSQLRGRPVNAKQGSSGVIDNEVIDIVYKSFEESLTAYDDLLAAGVAPEQARMVLPQGVMTDWYWTGSLVFWHRVCSLRLDPHSQQETSEVAAQISKICSELFPISWQCLTSGGK
jgi:thymidylate synthase (FAD)